jgi:hypothetical protein
MGTHKRWLRFVVSFKGIHIQGFDQNSLSLFQALEKLAPIGFEVDELLRPNQLYGLDGL